VARPPADDDRPAAGLLTDEQLLRYSRQIVLPSVDVAGQQRLAGASALVAGLGGLGSPIVAYLAAAGIGRLVLTDPDTVDLSNLHRQILHRTGTVGMTKPASARRFIEALNPDVEVVVHERRLTDDALLDAVGSVDVVTDCTDNFASRFALNAACVARRKPLVYGAVIGMEGQASVFRADRDDSPCYACLYPDVTGHPDGAAPASNWENCSSQGVLGPVAGLVGCIQATEALKVLLGLETGLMGKLLLIDAHGMDFHSFRVRKNPACPACGRPAAPHPATD